MKWIKKEGDILEPGDVIVEVETDKATVGFEVQEPGFLAKILITEGQIKIELIFVGTKDVPLGAPVAIVVTKKSDVAAFANFKPGTSVDTEKPAPKATATASSPPPPPPPPPT